MATFKSIDLFAGIGGIRLGFDNAFKDDIETVFIMSSHEYSVLSASSVKEIAKFKGDYSQFVPDVVRLAIEKKMNR